MNNLYAPWRSEYTTSTARTKNEDTTQEECVFCTILQEDNDEQHFLLRRFEHSFVILNQYPYNAGHILILPNEHQANLEDLSSQARCELMELSNASITALKKIMKPEAFNIGLNLGKAAGGSIPEHLHMHVLPRWGGDTNFLPALAQTKAISCDLVKVYQDLKSELDRIQL